VYTAHRAYHALWLLAGEAKLCLQTNYTDIGKALSIKMLLHTQAGTRRPLVVTIEVDPVARQTEVRY
jgi:hypothetical protein